MNAADDHDLDFRDLTRDDRHAFDGLRVTHAFHLEENRSGGNGLESELALAVHLGARPRADDGHDRVGDRLAVGRLDMTPDSARLLRDET